MTGERWTRIEQLFHELADAAEAPSAEDVVRLCGSDQDLAREVLVLLRANIREREQQRFYSEKTGTEMLGRRIGPYQVERLLGRGGMGAVYLARRADGEFDQRVAIKVIGLPLDSPFFRQRLKLERQILANLEHPHIARLLDGGVTPEGMLYLVVEYVEGATVENYCRDNRLGIADRVRLLAKVCEAVHYAHRHLVIHCDLKPGNILVNSEGIPKLLDFGTAMLLSAEAGENLTAPRLMTVRYASPEQLRGGRVSTASDIYSLGVILYELLAGVHPFAGPAETLDTPERHAPKPSTVAATRSLSRQLSGDLDGIVGKAMETEPAKRYGSAEQLREDLARHLKGQPVLARTHTWGYRAGKLLSRNPRSSALTAALAVLLVSVSLYSVRQAREARLEAEKANLVSHFLQNVLAYPQPQLGSPRQDLSYSGVMDSARRQVDSTLGGHPEVAAVVRDALAHGYFGLGQQQVGAKLARQALDWAESAPRPDPVLLGHLFSDLGNSMSEEGRYEQADRYFQRALAISAKGSSPENAEQRRVTLEQAALLRFARGDGPDRLDPMYDEALLLSRRSLGPDSLTEAQLLAERARVRLTFGQLAEAHTDLDYALRIVRKQPRASIFQLQTALILRCICERMAGNLGQARPFCEEALTASSAPSDRTVVPIVRAEIARIDVLEGRIAPALEVLKTYLEMCRKDRAHWELGYALTSLGQALVLGGRLEEAEPLLREALAVRRTDLPAGHPWTMDTAGELGALLLTAGRCAEAAPLVEESWTGFRKILPPSHPYLVRADDRLRLLRLRCPSPVGVGQTRRN